MKRIQRIVLAVRDVVIVTIVGAYLILVTVTLAMVPYYVYQLLTH